GSATADNIALVSLSAKRNYERPTEVQVFARLANYGPKVAKSEVTLSVASIDPADPAHLKFESRANASVALVPASWTDQQREQEEKASGFVNKESVAFKLDLTTAAVIKVAQTRT